jgi:prostaglandin-E synthase 1
MPPIYAMPAVRLFALVAILLIVKLMAVGSYTSYLRIRRRTYATPEDYTLQGLAPRATVDPDVERVRRAHQNDLENVLPFLIAGFLYALTGPSLAAARIYFIGFLAARVLHSIFYIAGMQPHRTIAFTLGAALTVAMMVNTLVALAWPA